VQGLADGLGLNKSIRVSLNSASASAWTHYGSEEITVKIKLNLVSDDSIKSTLLHEYAHTLINCKKPGCSNNYPGGKSQARAHCECWLTEYKKLLKTHKVDLDLLNSGDEYAKEYYLDCYDYSQHYKDLPLKNVDDRIVWEKIGCKNKHYTQANALACAVANEEVHTLKEWNALGYAVKKGCEPYALSAAFNSVYTTDKNGVDKWMSKAEFFDSDIEDFASYQNIARGVNFYVFCKCQVEKSKNNKKDLKLELKNKLKEKK
jgi:hypothetical protein